MAEGTVDGAVVIRCIDEFCKTLQGPTIVVMDNASIHTRTTFQAQLPRWEQQGLEIFYLGLILSGALGLGLEAEAKQVIAQIDFSQTLMHGMLSFLLFAGALHVNLDHLLQQKWVIGICATVGILCSTFLVGLAMYYLLGWLGLALPLITCLTFGSLISPTDPIAVLGLLKQANAPKS